MFKDDKTRNNYAVYRLALYQRQAVWLFVLSFVVLFCFASESKANERQLILKGQDISSIPLAPYMGRIRDPRSELNSRKAIEAFDNGQAEYAPLNQSKLGFGMDGTPSWFILRIKNETNEEKFIFSLTEELFYSQGTIEQVVLYGADQNNKEITASLDAPFFKFDIPKNTDTILLLYINPADYIPLILTPQISTETNFFILHDAQKDGFKAAFFMFLGLGLASFLAYIFKSARFIPHFLCFSTFGVLLISAKLPLLHDGFYEFFHPLLLLLILTTMGAGTFLQNKITIKDKNEVLSVGLPFVLTILASVVVLFLPEGFGLMSVILLIIPATLLCFSFVVLCLAFYQDGYKSSIWNCFAWTFLAITLIIFMLGGFSFYNQIAFVPVSLPYVTLIASIIFLFLSVISTRTEPGRDQTMEFAVLPTSVKDLKEAEEEGEYNRLLTVVERERQMMAELRQIDARRRKDMQKAKESADEANRAKSAFLAVISHEIRTPMTGIMGLVRLLMDTPLSAEQQKYAKSIMESGESMTLLLNDILDFEKIETGKMTLEQTFFNIKQVVQSTATLMAGHAQNKNIYLSLEVHPSAPLEIKGDPSRLRQVLLNLVGNAIKFTDEGGVTIRLKKGTRNEDSQDDNKTLHPFAIEIEDTGIGIAQDAVDDLFNPFSQADKSIAGKYGGSGLGLAICQRLVELMGGEITVESTLDKGSIFTIHLLVETKEDAIQNKELEKIDYTKVKSGESTIEHIEEEIEQEEEDMSLQYEQVENPDAQKIMVVEDNLVSQQVIESFLKKQGHDVTACSNAEDALILAEGEKFDIVFMDWELPGMSGPEAIRKMKSEQSLFIPHAVLLTGHRVSIEETGLEEEQLAAIINKPVMPEDLEKVISSLTFKEDDVRPIETTEQPLESLEEEQPLETEKTETVIQQTPAVPERQPAPQQSSEEDRKMPWNYKQSVKSERPPILDEIEALQDQEQQSTIEEQDPSSLPEQAENKPKTLWENEVFDQQMIASLLETLGESKVKELLGSVLEKTDEILVDLRTAIETENIQDINARAHELKGMAGNFALLQMHDLAEALEEDVKTKAGSNAESLLEQINQKNSEVKEALSKA